MRLAVRVGAYLQRGERRVVRRRASRGRWASLAKPFSSSPHPHIGPVVFGDPRNQLRCVVLRKLHRLLSEVVPRMVPASSGTTCQFA